MPALGEAYHPQAARIGREGVRGSLSVAAGYHPVLPMKMNLLVRDDVPLGFAAVAIAHASLAAYLRLREHPDTQAWIDGPFHKVVCRVDENGSRPSWLATA